MVDLRFLRQPNRPMPARPLANSGRVAGSGTGSSPESPKLPIGVDRLGSSTTDVNGLSAVNVDAPGPVPFPIIPVVVDPSLPTIVNADGFGLALNWVWKVRSVNVFPTRPVLPVLIVIVGLVAGEVLELTVPPEILTGSEEEKSTCSPANGPVDMVPVQFIVLSAVGRRIDMTREEYERKFY